LFTLHTARRVRLDVAPFVVLYVLGFGAYLFASPSLSRAANVATPIVAGLHVLTFLSCHWSLPLRCALQLRRVRRIVDATLVRARAPGSGRSELCELERRPALPPLLAAAAVAAAAAEEVVRFEHRKRTYVFEPAASAAAASSSDRHNDDSAHFRELTMPVSLPLSHYLSSLKGLRGESLVRASYKYGDNSFGIPARSFGSLFVEHALAPFFVFQAR
jgi:cation-transporting ATPase 13A1